MLVNIRRDLALGRMDIESGKEQIDVALAGLTIDKMFQKDVGEILGYLSSISSGIDEVSKEYALLEEKMSEVENLEGNEATMVEALKRSCGSRLKSINETADLARSRGHKMSGKMWRLRLVAPKCVEEVQAVAEKVLQGTESVEEKLDSLMERLGIKRVGDDFSKGDVQIRSRRSGRRMQTYAALKRGH